ncbi:hypothetical protein [Cognaticolwellia mytili]|uniref:hypothetical protein n=1 Tax=Cognaticolwellia mytili TaxID=1888913 RepID=UPI000A1723BD|nr:hypothetical protein [Cognaticolwellia mytili]
MKKVFRFLLLLLVVFAIYGGFVSQVWSYSIGIIAFSFLCFIGTIKGTSSSNGGSYSSASDCSGSNGGC